MTLIGKFINIGRNCNIGEANACDCVLHVCVRILSTNWDFSRPAFSTNFLSRFVDGDTLSCLRIGLSTNRDVDESGCRRIGLSANRHVIISEATKARHTANERARGAEAALTAESVSHEVPSVSWTAAVSSKR